MRTFFEVTGVGLLVVSALVGFVAALRWHNSRTQRFWAAAAARLGGELRVESDWPGVACSISIDIDGQRVELRAGRKRQAFASASMRHPEGFVMKVHPRPPSWLEGRPAAVTTGDPVFDRIFAVESSDPATCRTWLDETLRDALSRAGEVWIEVRGGRVLANRTVFDFQEDALENLASATAKVAAKGDGSTRASGVPRNPPELHDRD